MPNRRHQPPTPGGMPPDFPEDIDPPVEGDFEKARRFRDSSKLKKKRYAIILAIATCVAAAISGSGVTACATSLTACIQDVFTP